MMGGRVSVVWQGPAARRCSSQRPAPRVAVPAVCSQPREPSAVVTLKIVNRGIGIQNKVTEAQRTEAFGVPGVSAQRAVGRRRCGARDTPSSTCTAAINQPPRCSGAGPGHWPEMLGS